MDVGGEYNPANNRYDHHQREFTTTFPQHDTKLSSAGLVYMHFGKDIIAQERGLARDSQDVDILHLKLYDNLIEAFDANDNGISVYDPSAIDKAGLHKRFNDRNFSLASLVQRYNQHWDDDKGKTAEHLQQEEDARFLKASTAMGEQFDLELQYLHKAWLPARAVVQKGFQSRKQYDPKGRIMVLEDGAPWSDHLSDLESSSQTPEDEKVLYVLFPESASSPDQPPPKWRIRAVPASPEGGFETRKPLPEAWRGVRDEQLDQVTGVPGCVFVHASGFIGGSKTFEGALNMAQLAVDM